MLPKLLRDLEDEASRRRCSDSPALRRRSCELHFNYGAQDTLLPWSLDNPFNRAKREFLLWLFPVNPNGVFEARCLRRKW
jgi:hypothetical protein